jgi:Na+/H+-dicarboxylate symporter/ABC-type amino acid transport substrate-binding protein
VSLATQVLIGVGLGIGAGIFFGEKVAFFKVAGDAFIQLLQMTVLPYVLLSLIAGLGGLSYKQAAALARKGGAILVLLWTLGVTMVLLTPLAFPNWQTASFFSPSLIQQTPTFNFLSLYIPANPFNSLSNNVVPAVVVFSVFLGVALIGISDKGIVLNNLGVCINALGRVTGWIVRLAPFGVFAIIASATGTMRLPDLQRLQVFMVTYAVMSLLLTFWILPGLVASLTPIRYCDLVGPTRDALVTAFATGNIFIVLPVLAERSKELLKKATHVSAESDADVDVIISTSFSFPNLGKILTLSFVLFAGWFADSKVPVSDYATFAFSGLFSFFGDPNVAIPFLLDLLRIPSDTYGYFPVVDSLVGARFGTLLAAMYTLALAVLVASAVSGLIRFRWPALLRFAAITVVLTFCAIGGVRVFFEKVVRQDYRGDQSFAAMDLSRKYAVAPPQALRVSPAVLDPRMPRLAQIRERRCIRIGYFADSIPFAFSNRAGNLVGFDVEMAHRLAQDMKVGVEFVALERRHAAVAVNSGHVDLIMSSVALTLERANEMTMSAPYMNETFAFIVRDHRREEFSSRTSVKGQSRLKLGIVNAPYYVAKAREYLPQAQLVLMDSPREFFTRTSDDLDGLVYSAESGSAWTLMYPAFSIAVPQPDVLAVPLAYGVPRGDRELADFVNTWIDLKSKDQTIRALYDYWILGRSSVERPPRWSVMRDVLHLGL